jgi:hypothetical protein
VPVWYVAPLEMNEGTHWGQGYNQPIKRPLTVLQTMEKVKTPTIHHSLGVNYMFQRNVPLFTLLVSRFKQFVPKGSCLSTSIQLQMLQAYKRHIITKVR